MSDPKIVLLAGKGLSTNILYHALQHQFPICTIILEEPVSKKDLLKKRIKKLGFWKVAGQVLFQLIIVKFLNLIAAVRKQQILENFSLDTSGLPEEKIKRVSSVNDDNCLQLLQNIAPQLVIVNGTRIISKRILGGITAPFINIHAGITPMYRGVHGAYWALVNKDEEHCGVTVHLVDAGIDTGDSIAQITIKPSGKDNFVTYPLLQLAAGIPLMKNAITDALAGRLSTTKGMGESRLWSHPGIGQYLWKRMTKGIK